MGFALLKYTLIFLNILLYSQTELETTSKMQIQSCSKLLNLKYREKPDPDVFSKMMLSCFVKITQSQSEKILNSKESDTSPLNEEEIEALLDMNNLKEIPEEELKQKSDLMDKLMKEIESPKKNLRNLVDVDEDGKDQNKDLNATIDDKAIKDADEDDDDDDDYNDINFNDTNYYGNDFNDTENMYDDYYKDYYDDDYYDDDYWKNGNYDAFGNMSDEDYAKMYDNNDYNYNYNYNENQSYKEMFMENKFACIFIICLIIMVILIAIFGKDFEDTQTLEIDPNKNKHE